MAFLGVSATTSSCTCTQNAHTHETRQAPPSPQLLSCGGRETSCCDRLVAPLVRSASAAAMRSFLPEDTWLLSRKAVQRKLPKLQMPPVLEPLPCTSPAVLHRGNQGREALPAGHTAAPKKHPQKTKGRVCRMHPSPLALPPRG